MNLVPARGDATIASDGASPFADPGKRLAARTIDAFLPLGPFLLLYGTGAAMGSLLIVRLSFVALVLAMGAAFVIDLLWLHRYGQSIGKRLLGIRIVRTTGARVSLGRVLFARMFLPTIIGVVPVVGALFGFTNTLFIFSKNRRCVHDHFADTIVVDVRHAPETVKSTPTVF